MINKIHQQFPSLEILENVALSEYTYMKVGGACLAMLFPSSVNELEEILKFCDSEKIEIFILGCGSNVIVNDEGLDRIVVNTKKIQKIELNKNLKQINASAGVELSKLSKFAQQEGLSGLEFSCGIPGSVGGAIYMNAGAYDGEMKDVVISVRAYVFGQGVHVFTRDQLLFSYRKSVFSTINACILDVVFELNSGDQSVIQEKIQDFTQKREEKQPLDMASSGSTFKRPEGFFAGKLITDAGLKGKQIGGAMVSPKHAGFIVNIGNAKAQDLLDLIDHVRDEVFKQFNVRLEPEVKFLQKDGSFKQF